MQASTFTLPGLALATLGCVVFHLASPHQRWLVKAMPTWPACAAGSALLLLALLCLLQAMRPLTAIFLFLHVLMLAWITLPYLGAWRSLRRRA